MDNFAEMIKHKIENYYTNSCVGTLYGDLPIYRIREDRKEEIIQACDVYNFEAIKTYTNFFSKVPNDKYEEVTTQIAHIIFSSVYSHNLRIWQNKKIKVIKNNKEPKSLIKNELKTLKNFKELIIRNFCSSFRGKNIMGYFYNGYFNQTLTYSIDKTIKNQKTYNIDDLFEIVDLMIHDLETEEYLFLAEENYRERANTNTGINQYKKELIAIGKQYKIHDYKTNIDFFIQDFYKECTKNIFVKA